MKEYGILRFDNGRSSPFWQAFVGRQGKEIIRNFYDVTYGGSREARIQAVAYRNEVIKIFSPLTTLMASRKLRSNNKSGVSGVTGVKRKGEIVAWQANLEHNGKTRTKKFSVRRYGFDGAKQAAISQRELWVSELENTYRLYDAYASITVEKYFPDPDNLRILSEIDFKAKLAELNEHFDQLRPLWIRVSVRVTSRNRLQAYVSDSGKPARTFDLEKPFNRINLHKALAIIRYQVAQAIIKLYDEEVAEAFLMKFGSFFNILHFPTETGLSIHERVAIMKEHSLVGVQNETGLVHILEKWTVSPHICQDAEKINPMNLCQLAKMISEY